MTTQLAGYLSDAHAIEEQALAQLRSAPGMAGDERLAAALAEHLRETETHERLVRERLDRLGEVPARWKDLIMAVGGKGFLAFARSQPDTPGKLAAHAYAYEHLEIAGYELLTRVARQAGDSETGEMAARILPDERLMAERLEALFDDTVRSSLAAVGSTDANEQVPAYLSDAHALEQQSIGLLRRAVDVSTASELADAYQAHLGESEQHAALLERRLDELGRSPSAVKDAAMRIGAVNWATFFRAHPDTTGKVAAFAYAFEHLEIAGYEQLRRVAETAGDAETARVANEICADERAAAAIIAAHWDVAARAALTEAGAQYESGVRV
jgi:ferritin-like metal-binding protein YciE